VPASTKKRRKRQVQAPQRRPGPAHPWLWGLLGAVPVIAAAIVLGVVLTRSDGSSSTSPPPPAAAAGLPETPDYHSLMVSRTDPRTVLLGTHEGLFRSSDGGRTWDAVALEGQDAMNLVRPGGDTLWAAGHNVLAKSLDGGQTWTDVRPAGLPGLDVHGFAADPSHPKTLYAAIAGQGLYRSIDGGNSFAVLSTEVGPAVMALAVLPDGRILAGDMQRGLLISRDGGKTWKLGLRAGLMGLAVNPSDSSRIVATGPGILLSTNGGGSWRRVVDVPEGAGPVAWSRSNPRIAYAVGFDRTLYRTADRGRTWSEVG
jgi:photosystem II stability/assembly factor-like uncharacterized protein